jgi:NTP pyrophosphatase (non-canonical NTP hydrolase)
MMIKEYSDNAHVHVEDGTAEAIEDALRKTHAHLALLVTQLDEAKRRREAGLESARLRVVMPQDTEAPTHMDCGCNVGTHAPTFDAALAEADAWQRATFPGASPTSAALHLASELGEYIASIAASGADASFLVDDVCARIRAGAKKGRGETAEEIADLLFLVVQMASANKASLFDAFVAKLAKNKARVWKKPDAAGVVEHEKEGA